MYSATVHAGLCRDLRNHNRAYNLIVFQKNNFPDFALLLKIALITWKLYFFLEGLKNKVLFERLALASADRAASVCRTMSCIVLTGLI
jgi:hypothetical protein